MQIGSLSVGEEAESHFVQLYVIFMNQLVTVLPITADIPKAYQQGSDDEQEFVQNLAIFLTGFLKVQHPPPNLCADPFGAKQTATLDDC